MFNAYSLRVRVPAMSYSCPRKLARLEFTVQEAHNTLQALQRERDSESGEQDREAVHRKQEDHAGLTEPARDQRLSKAAERSTEESYRTRLY